MKRDAHTRVNSLSCQTVHVGKLAANSRANVISGRGASAPGVAGLLGVVAAGVQVVAGGEIVLAGGP